MATIRTVLNAILDNKDAALARAELEECVRKGLGGHDADIYGAIIAKMEAGELIDFVRIEAMRQKLSAH
jgi:hypothetical protein